MPVEQTPLAGDYVPYAPPADELPAFAKGFLDGYSPAEIASGAAADRGRAAALHRHRRARHARAGGDAQLPDRMAGAACADAPPARWIGINQANCAVTVLLYRAGRPPSLVSFNDMAHLPDRLRWTGFPPAMHV